MLLSVISSLLVTISNAHAAEINAFECVNDRSAKINLTIERALLVSPQDWTVSGDDGTNPFDCIFRRQAESGNFVFGCSSYQGAPYGYLSIYKDFAQNRKIRFVYIDENNLRFTKSFSGTCSRK